MTDTQPVDPERQKWLTDTLYALRGYFRESTPDDPNDLTHGQEGVEGITVHCIDSRIDEKTDLHAERATYFTQTTVAGAVPPPKLVHNASLKASLAATYPLLRDAKTSLPKPIRIIGHEKCTANVGLQNALLHGATRADSSTLNWILPMAPEGMATALKDAKERGASDEELQHIITQTTVLESMKNLYDEEFIFKEEPIRVRDLVDQGKYHIIGAVRGLTKNAEGRFPLKVYDPEQHKFRLIEDIYREAFPFSEQAIIDRKEALQPPPVITDTDNHSVIVPQGATTETVAKFNLSDIKAGIAALLDKMRATGVTKS